MERHCTEYMDYTHKKIRVNPFNLRNLRSINPNDQITR